MIIGLTGLLGCGKGAVAEILVEKGFKYYSHSDMIRDSMREAGIEITRSTLTKYANDMRSRFGAGVWADKIIEKLEKDKDYVVDSFRHPQEVKKFKNFDDFYLIKIIAPIEIRLARLIQRHRENDPTTLEQLKLQEEEENKEIDANQQLNNTIQMADFEIDNNTNLRALKEKVLKLISN